MSLNRPTRWAIALALTAVAVAISYQWLDRPIAYFAHAHFHNEPLFTRLTPCFKFVAAVIYYTTVAIKKSFALFQSYSTR